jgi:thiol-disulfide isomerase/thioredoxin/TolA-binding protein
MNRLHRSIAPLGIIALALTAAPVSAKVDVGDAPTLKFSAFDNKGEVDLKDLKGKIVIIDFWATWCGPCMAEAPHMVEINKKYADQGVQMIGISLDSDPSDLKKVIKEKNFTWPMSFEGKGWDGSYPKQFGVTGIPQTFIIGPDGTVLWRGHPAQIDGPLADALKNHPPQLVDPATVTAAKAKLDEVEAALNDNQPAKAIKALSSIPDTAKHDTDTAERIKNDGQKIADLGKTKLDAVDAMISDKQIPQAIAELQNISRTFAGTDTGAAAKKKLASMGGDPDVKKAVAAAKQEEAAAAALKVADKAKADHKDEKAYPLYQKIVKNYPGTPSAGQAAAAVTAYEADTTFITKYTADAKAAKAASILSLADSDRVNGATDKARELYQKVIADYPGTTAAETAKAAIEQMGN